MTKLTGPQDETMSTFAQLKTRHPMALCCQYCGAHFDEQQVQVIESDGVLCKLAVSWAVGVLADGDWEALGAWPGAAVGPAFWRGVWSDLDSRGVDKISLMCAADLDALALCPEGKVLPPFGWILGSGHVPASSRVGVLRADARRVVREASGVRSARLALERLLAASGADSAAVLSPDWPEVLEQLRPFYAMRPHRRAFVRAGDEYLEQLGHGLRQAVARHGPFADQAAAVSFVAQTISREELRLKFAKLSATVASRPALRLVGSGVAGAAGAASPGH
jgi:Transposase, Mutator family